jgi:CRP/FNR family cyclic AMP-dependent transcriptional regulator
LLREDSLREWMTNAPPASSLWSPHGLQALRSLGFSQAYPPGVSLFVQGSPVQTVGLIEEGLVKLMRWENQTDDVTVAIRGDGWPLGSTAALLQVPHIVTAETLTRSQILLVPADRFLTLVRTDERLSADLHHIHAWEIADYVTHLAGLGALSTRDRLLHLIGQAVTAAHTRDLHGPLRVTLPLKYSELARAVVTTRQHLARVLRQLEDDNLVLRQKGCLVIPDPVKFWRSIRNNGGAEKRLT